MARQPLFNIRLDPETRARWDAAAGEAGIPLSEFVRTMVERGLRGERGPDEATAGADDSGPTAETVEAGAEAPRPVSGSRRGSAGGRRIVCARERHHRSQQFCKTCGITPA